MRFDAKFKRAGMIALLQSDFRSQGPCEISVKYSGQPSGSLLSSDHRPLVFGTIFRSFEDIKPHPSSAAFVLQIPETLRGPPKYVRRAPVQPP